MLHINTRAAPSSNYARSTRACKTGAAKRAQAASQTLLNAAPKQAFQTEPKVAEPAQAAPAKVNLIK